MKHEIWLDSPEYYYNKATGLFFRRTLTLDEIIEYGISEETLEDDLTAHASDGETQNDSGTEDPLMSQARAVYTYMKEHGEIADDGDVSQVTASCNAKGNFYAIFESGKRMATAGTIAWSMTGHQRMENASCLSMRGWKQEKIPSCSDSMQ